MIKMMYTPIYLKTFFRMLDTNNPRELFNKFRHSGPTNYDSLSYGSCSNKDVQVSKFFRNQFSMLSDIKGISISSLENEVERYLRSKGR